MAISDELNFQVWGPSLVSFHATGGTPDQELGYTDNSDLVNFELDIMTEPIMTTRMGNIPEQYVHLGTIGYLNMTLVKWNETNIRDLITTSIPSADTEGAVGAVGSVRMGVQGTTDTAFGSNFSLRIAGASNSESIDFHNCIIEGRGFRRMDFGNKPQRIGLSIVCLPKSDVDAAHAGTNQIYTYNY